MEFSDYIWGLYKNSKKGQSTIKEFGLAIGEGREYELFQKYCPYEAKFSNKETFLDIAETFWCYGVAEFEKPKTLEQAYTNYIDLISYPIIEGREIIIPAEDYKMMLAANITISLLLYHFAPEFYFPNFFKFNAKTLNKILDTFNIELPKLPKKSDYKGRCLYYWHLCIAFKEFREKHNLNPSEMCAFLYDFSPSLLIEKEIEIPKSTQAWFIGGKTNEIEAGASHLFWQANPETKKGDILIHYEKTPVSAINSIWIAQTDGIIDPFFHYYSNTYIINRIEIPPISIHQLKEDLYFKDNPLVKKNFQGVNGYPLSNEDYKRLLKLIKEKGFEINKLPSLYTIDLSLDVEIKKEVDVEVKLLEPLLKQVGLVKEKDYIKQLPIKAGRGHRIYPDYVLFYDKIEDQEKAEILIEAKLHIKNSIDLHNAFTQARSYANLLEANKIILCDKTGLIIFEKTDSFDRNQYTRIYWNEFKDTQVLNMFQKLIKQP